MKFGKRLEQRLVEVSKLEDMDISIFLFSSWNVTRVTNLVCLIDSVVGKSIMYDINF